MTQSSKTRKFPAENARPRRALLCLDQDGIFRIAPRALRIQQICPEQRSFNAATITSIGHVRDVASVADETECSRASCMTSETWFPVAPAISVLSTRNIIALVASSISMRTCPTTPCPKLTTRIGSFPWPCVSSWRMACLIKPPVGTFGATTGFLSRTPPSKTGWRPGGKKAASQMDADYLDWALADFSGYIAADEL